MKLRVVLPLSVFVIACNSLTDYQAESSARISPSFRDRSLSWLRGLRNSWNSGRSFGRGDSHVSSSRTRESRGLSDRRGPLDGRRNSSRRQRLNGETFRTLSPPPWYTHSASTSSSLPPSPPRHNQASWMERCRAGRRTAERDAATWCRMRREAIERQQTRGRTQDTGRTPLPRLAPSVSRVLQSMMPGRRRAQAPTDSGVVIRRRGMDTVESVETDPTPNSLAFAVSIVLSMLGDDDWTEPPVLANEQIAVEDGSVTRRLEWTRREVVQGPAGSGRGIGSQIRLQEMFDELLRAQLVHAPHNNSPESASTEQPSAPPPEVEPDPNDEAVKDEDPQACCICFERKGNTKLKPCGHETCMTCTRIMDAKATDRLPFTCPICRCKVEGWALKPHSEPKLNEPGSPGYRTDDVNVG